MGTSNNEKVEHVYKRCYGCLTKLPLEAKECPECSVKLGVINKHGMAKRPVNFMGYILTVVIWTLLGYFVWWAFFK